VVSGGFDHSGELDPISFDAALYGEMTVIITVPNDPRVSPKERSDLHNAGRRFFGPTHNTSVSAVAALDRIPHVLRIYHNKHARRPLDPARLTIGTTYVEHYVKVDSKLVGWERVFAN
ncbi:MAG: hypothetical protein ACXW13_05015, partial [Burkholderiaceae bacterium]